MSQGFRESLILVAINKDQIQFLKNGDKTLLLVHLNSCPPYLNSSSLAWVKQLMVEVKHPIILTWGPPTFQMDSNHIKISNHHSWRHHQSTNKKFNRPQHFPFHQTIISIHHRHIIAPRLGNIKGSTMNGLLSVAYKIGIPHVGSNPPKSQCWQLWGKKKKSNAQKGYS